MASGGLGSLVRRAASFFHRHPILLLLAFTPGIPEYLSGSSSVAYVVLFPGGTVVFLLFLGLNLGLYGPGVLLVREAWVRWGSGWGVLLLLGAAYGLLEEGTALSTLFNPNASVVGGLGHYGRAIGVNWLWLIGVIGVHVVLSVGIPILLLGLALPETRGRSLLSPRGLRTAVGVYAVDIVLLVFVANYWQVQGAWLVGAAVVASLLWVVASRLPPHWLDPPTDRPIYSPRTFFLLGLAYFPVLLIVPGLGGEAHLPAVVTGVLDLAAAALLFAVVRRGIGRRDHPSHLVALAFGATLPILLFGLIAQIRLPVVLVVDALYGIFFYALWKRYRPQHADRGSAKPPPVAV